MASAKDLKETGDDTYVEDFEEVFHFTGAGVNS
jgi:hypothetical protein